MQKVYLNIVPGGVVPDINVSQFDSGRTFQLAVMDGGVAADLTGLSVSVSGQKPDGFGFQYTEDDMVGAAHVVAVSGNIVTITTPVQMTAADGRVVCWLSLTDSDDNEISTLYFDLHVQKSPLVGVVISETELPAIIALAQQQEENAEAWAMGTRGGVPVTSDDPAYHNNAKYYADLAASAASGVLEKYPKIVADYWYIWDIDTEAYVNTGVKALGQDGQDGTDGVTPDITVTASVDDNTGTPAVTVTKGGTLEEPTFALAFSNLKGEPGGGGGGGHTIYNGAGTAMADEDGLQFEGGLETSDDSVGQKTVVSAGKKIAWADAEGYVGKNLLKVPDKTASSNGYTVSCSGGVFSTSGTASANTSLNLLSSTTLSTELKAMLTNGANVRLTMHGDTYNVSTLNVCLQYKDSSNVLHNIVPNGNMHTIPAGSTFYALAFYLGSGVTSKTATFTLMLRYADITDDTYEPWIPKNTELVRWTEQNVYGAKNLLPNRASSKTASKVTYTVAADGSVNIDTAGEAATANVDLTIFGDSSKIPGGLQVGVPYIFGTGAGSNDALSLLSVYRSGSWVNLLNLTGDASGVFQLTSADTGLAAVIRASSGATFSNVKAYPMIRLATVEDDTFEPYALTNRAITEVGAILDTDVYGSITGSYDLDNFKSAGALLCTAANAANVTHKPYVSDEDFVIYNMHLMGSGYRQLYLSRSNTSGIWTRIFNGSWSSWAHNLTNIDVGSAAMFEIQTTVTNSNDYLPTGAAVTSLVSGLEILKGPLTGYVGDTTLTFTSVGYAGSSGPLMSFFSSNTSGKPVTIKTAVYDDIQDTATITFDALTEQTLFVMVINNTY